MSFGFGVMAGIAFLHLVQEWVSLSEYEKFYFVFIIIVTLIGNGAVD